MKSAERLKPNNLSCSTQKAAIYLNAVGFEVIKKPDA
jgi:hypothetical protein